MVLQRLDVNNKSEFACKIRAPSEESGIGALQIGGIENAKSVPQAGDCDDATRTGLCLHEGQKEPDQKGVPNVIDAHLHFKSLQGLTSCTTNALVHVLST